MFWIVLAFHLTHVQTFYLAFSLTFANIVSGILSDFLSENIFHAFLTFHLALDPTYFWHSIRFYHSDVFSGMLSDTLRHFRSLNILFRSSES